MGLTRAALARPVFILMLMLAAFLLGTIAYRSMRQELNPDVSFPVVSITTVYPGADPDTIGTLVSERIEDTVSGITNLRELSSVSQEGISTVTASFELGTNVDVALNDVRTRVDRVLSELPDGAERPIISKFDATSSPVLFLAFTSTVRDSRDLRDLLDRQLADRFAQIAGVAEATAQGGDVREIQIQLDKDRLLSYGLGITDVARQIGAASQNVPGGRLTQGDREYQVRVFGEWKSVDEIGEAVLTIQDPNNQQAKARTVRLRDVATIADATAERTSYSRLNGRDTVVLSIQKAREGNAIEISRQADELIESIKQRHPDLTVVKTFEQAKLIGESIADLNFTLFFGVFLVSAVVYLFLHNLRGMVIVAIAIPVCLFAAFCAVYLAGFTINNMTMLALILAVAVLVDDAIVVLENIYRHLRLGESPRDAALNGRGEIGLAAIAITLADVVVFLPIAFMGGIVGQFFKPMALTYVFAVLFSLFVSFTVTPMLAARWYRRGEDVEHPRARWAVAFERGFGRLESAYRRVLEWSLNHRWFVFILGNLSLVAIFMFIGGGFAGLGGGPAAAIQMTIPMVIVATFVGLFVFLANLFRRVVRPKLILYGFLFGLLFPVAAVAGALFGQWKGEPPFKFEFLPRSDNGQVSVNIEMPPGSSLDATQRIVERVEAVVSRHPDVKYVVSSVGAQGAGGFGGRSQGSNYAQVSGTLHDKGALLDRLPWKKHKERLRWDSDEKVAADILQQVGRTPGADLRVTTTNAQGFGSAIQMSFRSEDRPLLVSTTEEIVRRLRQGVVKGVINADVSSASGKPELQAVPDRDRLADAGVTVADVGAAIRTLYTGNEQATFRVAGDEYKVRVQLSDRDRNDPDIVSQVPVAFKQGEPIFLSSVAQIREESSVDQIQRRDRQQEVQISADLLPGFAAGSVQAQINAWIAKENLLPEGVTVAPLGQAQAQQRESGFLFGAFAIGLVLVYMLLASLYDNLLYPFIIQLAQPQALTGAILALVLTDKSLNLVGFIGLITLIGLVGKNAILLVDYTNTLRERGRGRHDALVEAGPIRLRPIAMTTVALILGVMPIALAIGRGSEFRETIGIVIIGGIALSTFLTLVVIPCSYTIFDDLSIWAGRRFGRRPRPGADDSGGPPIEEPVVLPAVEDTVRS